MHGFIHAQALDVGPVQRARWEPGHLLRVSQRGELDELRVTGGLDAPDQFGKRIADPRHHRGPGFDAAHAVNALF